MTQKPAYFISFEGGDGSGKTTQLAMLCDALYQEQIDYIRTREPGGTDNANAIRALVLEGAASRWDSVSELLLFSAARRDHVTQLITPALQRGQWVVCDRFADSTRAYQGQNEAIDADWLESNIYHATGGLEPHLTFLLDIAPEEGLKRVQIRNEGKELRFESKPLEFHGALREQYHLLAERYPQRMVKLDAAQDKQSLHRAIIRHINERFSTAITPL